MGIADVKTAFNQGLAGKGNCIKAEMGYLEGGKVQRFTFTVVHGGASHTVTEDIAGREDPNIKARAAGAAFAATLEG